MNVLMSKGFQNPDSTSDSEKMISWRIIANKKILHFTAPQIDSKPAKAVLKHTNLKKETNNGHVSKFEYIQHATQFNSVNL